MKKSKINTMEELALAIGISRPTLSRYFQDPDSVRQSTSARIKEGLSRLDYVPNFFATRLNRKNTGLIGVIVPHLRDLFFTGLLEEIEKAASLADYTVITQSSQGSPEAEAKAVDRFLSMNADGVIVAPQGEMSSIDALRKLSAAIPLVLVDSRLPELEDTDFVGTDNLQSVGLIVNYLCRTGQPPVFLNMPPLNSNSIERETAYRLQMMKLGLPPEIVSIDVRHADWEFESYGHDVMDGHFGRGNYHNSTILCANDRLAMGAIRAANRHGLFTKANDGLPRLKIAGHDDHALSAFMTPSLTTVAQDIKGIGKAAVDLLLRRARGQAGSGSNTKIFSAALKIRESA